MRLRKLLAAALCIVASFILARCETVESVDDVHAAKVRQTASDETLEKWLQRRLHLLGAVPNGQEKRKRIMHFSLRAGIARILGL